MAKKNNYGVMISYDSRIDPSSFAAGTILQGVPEPGNTYDPNAVAVYLGEDKVGYVCASEATLSGLPGGTQGAKHMSRLLSFCRSQGRPVAGIELVLDKEMPYVNASGRSQSRWIVNAVFKEAKAKTEGGDEYEYLVAGTISLNPGKNAVLAELKDRADDPGSYPMPLMLTCELGKSTGGFSGNIYIKGADEKHAGEIIPDQDAKAYKALYEYLEENRSVPAEAVRRYDPSENLYTGSGKLPGGNYVVKIALVKTSANAFEDEIAEAIIRGAGTREMLEGKVNYLASQKVSEKLIRKFLGKVGPVDKFGIPEKPRNLYRSSSNYVERALTCALLGINMCLFGPASGGKNVLAETICWLLNKPMLGLEGSYDTDKDEIIGGLRMKDGDTEMVISEYLEGLKDGVCLVIDEVNTIRADVLTKIHSLMDERKYIDVRDFGRVKINEDSIIIFTLNEGYEGTSEMNQATRSRTLGIEILPEMDLAMVFKDSGYDPKKIKLTQSVVDDVNKQGSDLDSVVVTIRGIDASLKASEFLPLRTALKMGLSGQCQDPVQRERIDSIIDLHVPLTV